MSKLKIAICYRVLQAWRVPIFERISNIPNFQICVFYGEDFPSSKLINYKGDVSFPTKSLPTKKISFRTRHGRANVPFNPSLYRELRNFNPDVIITEGASNIFNNISSFLFAKKNKKKIIQWGLGEIKNRKRSFARKLADIIFKRIERNSDAAISYSTYGAQYYRQVGLNPNNIFVAVNVVDTKKRLDDLVKFSHQYDLPLPPPPPNNFSVLFVGALTENKCVDLLILAFKDFIKSNVASNANLVIVGDGPIKPNLVQLCSNEGLDDNVIFTGNVSDGIAKYFYNASVFVLPGLGGLAVSDSLAHGVPVICGIGDGCEGDLINGRNGCILTPMNRQSLSDKLKELYLNPEILLNMRISANQFQQSDMTVDNYVNQIQRAVIHVLN